MTTVDSPAIAVVKRLYEAYNRHDVDGVLACWHTDGVEFLPLKGEMRARTELGPHLLSFYDAFPDARTRIDGIVSDGAGRVAVQVTLTGSFTGGKFNGLSANGRPWSARMAEFFTVENGLITRMDAYMDSMDLAQQLQLLPPPGSIVEKIMTGAFNFKVAVSGRLARKR